MLTWIVLFATWCPKCHMMMPVVDELEEEFGGVWKVVRIDIEKNPEEAEVYGVEIVPTFVMKSQDVEIGRMAGLIGEDTLRMRMRELAEKRKS